MSRHERIAATPFLHTDIAAAAASRRLIRPAYDRSLIESDEGEAS